MKLFIGNKNYSSWSLRAWLLLRQLGIPFEEEKISFNDPQWKDRVRKYNPVGRVPVLVDGDLAVWDSLAIVEYVAEKFPDRGVWPAARGSRWVPTRHRIRCSPVFRSMRSALKSPRARIASKRLRVGRSPHSLIPMGPGLTTRTTRRDW